MFKVFAFIFVVVVIMQVIAAAPHHERNTRICNYDVSETKDSRYRVNGIQVDDFVCFPFIEYRCTIPWLLEYCPGNVKVSHCFSVKMHIAKFVNITEGSPKSTEGPPKSVESLSKNSEEVPKNADVDEGLMKKRRRRRRVQFRAFSN